MLKIILLILFILSSLGSIFWWMKEKGYAPILALIGSLMSILMWYLDNRNSSSMPQKINYQTNNIKDNNKSPIANNVEQQNIYYNDHIDSVPKDKNVNKSEARSKYSLGEIHGNDNTVIQGDNNKVDKRKITVSKLKPEIKLEALQMNIPIEGKPSPILENIKYYQTKYKLFIHGDDTYNFLRISAKGEGIRYLDMTITGPGMMENVQMEHQPGEAICTISNPTSNEYFVLIYTTKPIDNFRGLLNIKLDKFDYSPIH